MSTPILWNNCYGESKTHLREPNKIEDRLYEDWRACPLSIHQRCSVQQEEMPAVPTGASGAHRPGYSRGALVVGEEEVNFDGRTNRCKCSVSRS